VVTRWESLAEDLLAVIDHFSPIEPVCAAGISMGTGTILYALTQAPSVFRGAGASDLPSLRQLADVRVPALILPWATDPTHPISTAERLAEALPAATLHVSDTADDVRTWAAKAAAFFACGRAADPRPRPQLAGAS
jgi:pimeloyl-ACP methyl ester carboxylesterase